ncbi:MAG: hypothetical protein U9Q24_02455 [Candidatus Ratteibacteria bacterium]|nr:hypothetical protein [Candidatus Ratteibacteria bacterium]
MTKLTFILAGIFLFSSLAWAENEKIEISSEYGRRSTASLIEEEDLDLDYRYAKGYFNFRKELDKHFGYKLGCKVSDKDYEIDESRDNQLKTFFWTADWFWLKEPTSIRWRLKNDYRERRYEHSPQNEYNQIKSRLNLTLKDKDCWQMSFEGGLNDYDYLQGNNKDELESYIRIKGQKYFLDKFLTAKAGYKLRHRERTSRADREEDVIKGGFDLKPDLDFIKLIRFQIENGAGNTIDIEEREDSHDYDYRRWYVLNKFKLSGWINLSLRYEDLKKDYLTYNHDYRGSLVENNWRFDLIKDKIRVVALNLGLSRKEMDYPDAPSLTFNRNRGSIGLSWRRKKTWGIKCRLDLSRYNFLNKKGKNKDICAALVNLEKKFCNQAVILNLRLRQVFKDYVQKADVEYTTCRLSLKYVF